jgi:hypothetical protein
MADELSQIISLPAELLSAIGQLREASSELGSQIRDTQRAIKEGEAAGSDVGELRDRLARMKDRKADIRSKIKSDNEQKKIDREGGGIFGRIARLRTGAHVAGRIAGGGFGIGDVGMAGDIAQRAGGSLIRSGRIGLGGMLARGGVAAARFASIAAGPVGIGVAAAIGAGRIAQSEYQNQRIAAQGTGQVLGRIGDLTRASAQGGSRFSAQQMQQITGNAIAAGFRATESVRKSSPIEFISRAFGFTQNSRASQLETQSQMNSIGLSIASAKYGSRIINRINTLNAAGNAEVRNLAIKKLRQQHLYTFAERLPFLRFVAAPAYEWAFGGDEYQEALQERIAKSLESLQIQDQVEMEKWLSPKNDVARALENERRHHVRAVDSERWSRFNAWGMQ